MLCRQNFHYGWIIVFSGILAIVAVLGLGRFSLGMILPSMGSDLNLSYSRMGFIGTGNFIGYLLAVVVSSRMVKLLGYRTVISGGIFLVGTSMIVVGGANGFWLALTAFFCTGIGSGLANVPVMVLISHWFGSSMRGRATGLVVSGSGLGIMLTGLLVPAINNWAADGQGWRTNWLILGSLVLAIGLVCALLIRNRPQDLGLTNIETSPKRKEDNQPDLLSKQAKTTGKRVFLHLGSIYFFFGFTYVIYVTFVITTLINDYSFSEAVAGRFWFWFGLLGIFSGPLFGSLSDHLGRGRTLALVFTLQAVSHLLLALNPLPGSVYFSIALFALCAWSVPSIVAAANSDYLGPLKAASGFAAITLLFGIGQISGPALAGILAEKSGSFSQAYLLASVLTVAAAMLSLFLPKSEQ
ncbi:MAG: YbfB/YjiJ family MFS transporter [Proteobacteria bacterium]|nr:YbfB/YjiJ family MFS transporter [Pseudomonadota bacterium]MBU1060216.1 YbfB/YjiJ family MFS transporter [Pseudomonadota bacterium]